MGFRAITTAFQEKIDEFQEQEIDQEVIAEIEDILEDYCCTLEEIYGLGLSFSVSLHPKTGRLHYVVEPETELDGALLAHITYNEAFVSRTTMMLQ